MTPLDIEILLHYHSRANDFRDGDFTAPAVAETIDSFRFAKDLLQSDNLGPRKYKLTERGDAHVLALLNLPLPVAVWVTPKAQKLASAQLRGSNGGMARARALSDARRAEIAATAANARWGNGKDSQ